MGNQRTLPNIIMWKRQFYLGHIIRRVAINIKSDRRRKTS